jgi:hypothetical protein
MSDGADTSSTRVIISLSPLIATTPAEVSFPFRIMAMMGSEWPSFGPMRRKKRRVALAGWISAVGARKIGQIVLTDYLLAERLGMLVQHLEGTCYEIQDGALLLCVSKTHLATRYIASCTVEGSVRTMAFPVVRANENEAQSHLNKSSYFLPTHCYVHEIRNHSNSNLIYTVHVEKNH